MLRIGPLVMASREYFSSIEERLFVQCCDYIKKKREELNVGVNSFSDGRVVLTTKGSQNYHWYAKDCLFVCFCGALR